MAEAFPIGGSIDPATFPFLLANLHQGAATGSLKVDGPSYQKALYFRGGRVLFGSSNDPHDQLGAILIESGRLSAEQLDAAATKVGPGNPLAKVLADSGLVSQRDLAEAARAKVERILCDLLAMTSGSFEFEDDVLPKGAIDLKLLTPRLFAAALRRIPQRDFVERHLGGLDVVLRPAAAEGQRLGEIFADVGGLPDVLDGRRSLREAAALAQLDAFEAGKAACTLLFLGLVEKVREPPPAFEAIESEADELDLGATARITFDFAPPAEPKHEPPPVPPQEDGEMPFFLSGEAPAPAARATPPPAPLQLEPSAFQAPPEPEPAMHTPAPDTGAASAATVIVPPPAPPEPPAEPTIVPRPPVARGGRADLPLVPPPPRAPRPARHTPARPDEPEPMLEPPALAPRPSRADLEALDSLLNARGLETPLAAGPRTAAPAAAPARRLPAWEPSFGRDAPARGRPAPARARAGQRGRSRSRSLAVLALLVAGVGAGAWYWLGRSRPPVVASKAGAVRPLALPGAGTTRPSPSAVAGAAPLVPPPATSETAGAESRQPPQPARASTAPLPATPAPTRAATPAGAGATPADDTRALLRRGDLAAAGRGFAATLKVAPRGTFSIQLLLACAPETVSKAVDSAGAPELFIVPIRYHGRDCYRLCWGLYDGRAPAESALRSVPSYFRAGGATPKVVPAAELLP